MKKWVRKVLGRHKAPTEVFWLGEDCSADVPLTGSGKIKKFVLREWAERLLVERGGAGAGKERVESVEAR